MKKSYIVALAIAATATLGITSCSDSFLDEKLITQKSMDTYKTQDGLDELMTGAYTKPEVQIQLYMGHRMLQHGCRRVYIRCQQHDRMERLLLLTQLQ